MSKGNIVGSANSQLNGDRIYRSLQIAEAENGFTIHHYGVDHKTYIAAHADQALEIARELLTA